MLGPVITCYVVRHAFYPMILLRKMLKASASVHMPWWVPYVIIYLVKIGRKNVFRAYASNYIGMLERFQGTYSLHFVVQRILVFESCTEIQGIIGTKNNFALNTFHLPTNHH